MTYNSLAVLFFFFFNPFPVLWKFLALLHFFSFLFLWFVFTWKHKNSSAPLQGLRGTSQAQKSCGIFVMMVKGRKSCNWRCRKMIFTYAHSFSLLPQTTAWVGITHRGKAEVLSLYVELIAINAGSAELSNRRLLISNRLTTVKWTSCIWCKCTLLTKCNQYIRVKQYTFPSMEFSKGFTASPLSRVLLVNSINRGRQRISIVQRGNWSCWWNWFLKKYL